MKSRNTFMGTAAFAVLACLLSAGSLASGGEQGAMNVSSPRVVTPEQLTQLNDGEAIDDSWENSESAIEAVAEQLEAIGIANEVPESVQRPEGFGSVSVDIPAQTITIGWKGEVPQDIARIAGDNPEVTVNVVKAVYTDDELTEAGLKIIDELPELVDNDGYISVVSQRTDGSGLSATFRTTIPELNAKSVSSAIREITDVPVTLSIDDADDSSQVVPMVGGRQNDNSPFYAGAGIRLYGSTDINGGYCSTGFAVKGKSTGKDYMTTAFHCIHDSVGTSTGSVYSESGQSMGTWHRNAANVEKDKDAALITLGASRSVAGRAYWSGVNATISHPVDGYHSNKVGAQVCTGGANSGTHCNLNIIEKVVGFQVIPGETVTGGWLALAPSGIAVAQGDSGGPVYRHNTTNGKRMARGLISGAGTYVFPADTSKCSGNTLHITAGTKCSAAVYFVGIVPWMDELNVNLK
ncbi:hypothetical protein SAMN06309944_0834 [Micrococcales bacterium KH10]|nr:hypothetical protein SAMN06309944_0834 [Micrococcales bacterium KH10]